MYDLRNETEKPLLAELGEVLWLSLPIIVTMTSQTMMQFVDAWMLGNYGPDEFAAVAPAGIMYYVVASFMIGVISCNNTFVSQSLGQEHARDCGRYTAHAIYLALFAQMVVLPIIPASADIFKFFGHAPEVQVLEVSYFRIRMLQLGGTGVVVALSSFFQATGRPIVPMLTGLCANLFNIFGDWLLIFGHWGLPEWGLPGAALATTLASYAEAVLLVFFFVSRDLHAKYGTRKWGPFELRKVRQLLSIGVGAGVNFALDVGSWAVFMNWIVGKLGKDVLAGNNAAMQFLHLSFMPAIGLNIGITALVGRHIGEKAINRAKRVAYLGMASACAYMTFMGIVFLAFRDPLIRLFSQDPDVVTVGKTVLIYAAMFQFSDAIGILSHGALKGAGDTKFPAIACALVAWFFFLPLGYFLGKPSVLGLHGAWLSATVYIWIIDVILFWRFVSERWRRIDIFK